MASQTDSQLNLKKNDLYLSHYSNIISVCSKTRGCASLSRRVPDFLDKKYEEILKRIAKLWPAESVTLKEVSKGRRFLRLQSGDVHEFEEKEIRNVLSKVPPYVWDLVKLPIILRYKRFEDGTYEIKVEGDVWQKRLVELLLKGQMTSKGMEKLDYESFRALLSEYRTLIFIGLGGLEETLEEEALESKKTEET
ncbi:MAG: DUF61 family protein [Acidilobaceae archaeon]